MTEKYNAKELGEELVLIRNMGINMHQPKDVVIRSMNQILEKYDYPMRVVDYTFSAIHMEPAKDETPKRDDVPE